MVTLSFVALASLLALAPVQAHYYIKSANGGTGALRPIAKQQGGENTPITGSQIETEDMTCGVTRPFGAKAAQPLQVTAGSIVKVTYDTTVFHTGPCFAYLGEGLKPSGWSKILEITLSPTPCDQVINNNGNSLDIKIPSELAPGSYVLRVDHIGLHNAGSAGGAQFYVRCIDIDVTGSGNKKPPYEVKIPGSWTGSTPGVLYNLYYPNGPPYANYPAWGGSVWNPNTSGPVSPVTSPKTSPATSPKTSPATSPKTSPATSPVTSPTGPCAKLYGQCGGSNYSGATCCESGTCTYVNTYYSQCK